MNDGTMIPCDQVVARLWEYLDRELSADSSAEVERHLEICSRCFPQYDFQRAYRDYVRQVQREPVPPALRQRIFEALLTEEASPSAADAPRSDAPAGTLSGFLRRVLGRE